MFKSTDKDKEDSSLTEAFERLSVKDFSFNGFLSTLQDTKNGAKDKSVIWVKSGKYCLVVLPVPDVFRDEINGLPEKFESFPRCSLKNENCKTFAVQWVSLTSLMSKQLLSGKHKRIKDLANPAPSRFLREVLRDDVVIKHLNSL